jgi:hypothetical protein
VRSQSQAVFRCGGAGTAALSGAFGWSLTAAA